MDACGGTVITLKIILISRLGQVPRNVKPVLRQASVKFIAYIHAWRLWNLPGGYILVIFMADIVQHTNSFE